MGLIINKQANDHIFFIQVDSNPSSYYIRINYMDYEGTNYVDRSVNGHIDVVSTSYK